MPWRILFVSLSLLVALSPLARAQEQAPAFTLRDMHGRQHKLKDYQGQVVVLNFWATWCAPCLHEMPILANLYTRYSGKGVVVLGASLDEASNLDRVETIVRKYKVNYPVFLDASPDTMESFGLENVPATILLDRTGRIIARISGEAEPAALKRQIDTLLNGNPHRHSTPQEIATAKDRPAP